MTKVACIGAGSFGTTIASLAAQNANDVVLWCRRDDLAAQINSESTNESYLPGIRLPEQLRATSDIEEAMSVKATDNARRYPVATSRGSSAKAGH